MFMLKYLKHDRDRRSSKKYFGCFFADKKIGLKTVIIENVCC